MNSSSYDENRELDRYVLNYFGNFMTELERLGQTAVIAEDKAKNTESSRMSKILIDKWGEKNNPGVVKTLSEGIDKFRRRVRERILEDHKEAIFINRCPQCNNIVMTPKAKMCLWCNYSWHKDS